MNWRSACGLRVARNVDAILANHSTLMNHALWPEYVGKLAKGVRYLGMPKVS